MAAQVEELCRNVGYLSAGTVEFLVDKNQHFYFLEMNTRLQVEHPVSEAITGVDLVKGMLWVGAGWGVPEEFKKLKALQLEWGKPVLPHSGHAIEARIYAEDPLRGFLPSTGPLATYSEPSTLRNTPEAYVRVDTGVTAGQNISPFYDPMLSKVIYRGRTRKEAIAGLCQALDEYVIQGVQHNTKLVLGVLRHPVFQNGNTPTSFLPTHFQGGFHGVELSNDEQLEYVAAVAAIEKMRREVMQRPPLAGTDDSSTVVVKVGGLFGTPYRVDLSASNAIVAPLNEEQAIATTIRLDSRMPPLYETDKQLAHVTINSKNRTLQILGDDATGEFIVQMYGADSKVLVQSVREYELSQHMHVPVELDTSDLIMSPMPGTLVSYAIQAGDYVEAGQELCIVEAMKMQNIIRSPKTGTIAVCKAGVGASLKRDEIIIEFEKV
jgi:propionyl-CoA carboxylase alpha chain